MLSSICSGAALALATLPLPTTAAASPDGTSLLSMVPSDSYALARCVDASALRSRAERNDWYQLLSSQNGAPLLLEFAREFESETQTDLYELLELGQQLQGESVLFLTGKTAGFVTEAPATRSGLLASMRAWLPDPGPRALSRTIELGDASVEIVAWPESDAYGWRKREGHFAALVDHPLVLGLFSGDDAESLRSTLEASLAGLESDQRAPVVTAFEAARSSKPTCLGIEAFVDLTPLVRDAERELRDQVAGFLPDPSGMLGLDQDYWLLSALEIYPGTRIDSSAWMNIPRDTLAASLADTFQPLPVDLAARLPRGLGSLHAWRWDLALFYERARTAFMERHGEESLQGVDQALEAARMMGGVDPISEVIEQLEGTFAIFQMRGEDEGAPLGLENFGFLTTLKDGEAFLESYEKLLGNGPLESKLDLVEVEGADVYVFGKDLEAGGLAFLPDALILGFSGTLARSLRAATGVAGANLLDGSDMHGAIEANRGCCYFGCLRLADVEAIALHHMRGRFVLPPAEGAEAGRSPFDSLLISTVRRTPDGFHFALRTQ